MWTGSIQWAETGDKFCLIHWHFNITVLKCQNNDFILKITNNVKYTLAYIQELEGFGSAGMIFAEMGLAELSFTCSNLFINPAMICCTRVLFWGPKTDNIAPKIFSCCWPGSSSPWSLPSLYSLLTLLSTGTAHWMYWLRSQQESRTTRYVKAAQPFIFISIRLVQF